MPHRHGEIQSSHLESHSRGLALPQRDVSLDEAPNAQCGTKTEERNKLGLSSRSTFTCPATNAVEAFNIGSMRDSRVMQQDSYIMRTLSVLAMIFLPISTVSTIFGTQFFSTTITPDPSSDNGGVTSSFYVNSRFWLLWIIALPMTLGLLLVWRVWIRRSRMKVKRANKRLVDVETADIGVTNRETSGCHRLCHPRERSHGGSISPR